MIECLLPPGAVTVEAGVGDWEAPLFPEEEALLARAVEKRRREFTAGRTCARRALERLGRARAPILTGAQREPIWPLGVVGSITHCPGYCAAVVALRADLRGIGIDAEVRAPLGDGVTDLVCTANECRWIAAQAEDHWPALLFSAKEAIYKVWYPLMDCWLDYQDVELTIDVPRRRFGARILRPVEPSHFPLRLEGRYALGDKRVYTAVTLPA